MARRVAFVHALFGTTLRRLTLDDMTLEVDPRNAGQLRDWDGEHGAYWAEHAKTYEASAARYQPALLAAIGAQSGSGCSTWAVGRVDWRSTWWVARRA